MNNIDTRNPSKWIIMIIYISFVTTGSSLSANAVLSKIMASFAGTPTSIVRLISTLPGLFSFITSLAVGRTVGRKLGYKTVLVLGLLMFGLGGAAPAVFNTSIVQILIARGVFGMGIGMLACRNGFLMMVTEGEQRQNVVSNGTMIQNLSGIVLNLIGGWLGDVDWRLTFCISLLTLIPAFLLVALLKEPNVRVEHPKRISKKTRADTKKKGSSHRVTMYCFIAALMALTSMSWTTGMSAILAEKGFTSAATVSLALASCQIGAVLAGIVFRFLNKRNPNWVIPFAGISGSLGCIIVIVSKSLPLVLFAGLLAGLGYVCSTVACGTYAAMSSPPDMATMVNTRVLASTTLATFFTGFYIQLFSNLHFAPTPTSGAFIVSILIDISIVICSIILKLGPKPVKPKER